MTVLSGYYALGTAITNAGVLTEATTYTRPTVTLTGSASTGLTQSLAAMTGTSPTGPSGGLITRIAIFDALTGGNMICYAELPQPYTLIPADFAALVVNIVFNTYVAQALSFSASGGDASSGSTLDQGAQIGTLGGQPLVAGCKLVISGGALVPQSFGGASGQQTFPADVNVVAQGTGKFIASPAVAIAAGTTRTQVGATALTKQVSRVDVATAPAAGTTLGDGVKLMAAAAGLSATIINTTAYPIQVYGNASDTVNGVAAATGVPQMARSTMVYTAAATAAWYSIGQPGSYTVDGLPISLPQNAVTAAGTNQATGLQLTGNVATITTAGAGTGVNLPTSVPGSVVTIVNRGANRVRVYPQVGAADTINGLAATVGVGLDPGATGRFTCTVAAAWSASGASPVTCGYTAMTDTTAAVVTAATLATGTELCVLNMSGNLGAGATLTLPTVAQLVAAMHMPVIGKTFVFRVIRSGTGAFVWTLTDPGGGTWTLTGGTTTSGVAATAVDFLVTLTSMTAGTMQRIGYTTGYIA